MSRDEITRNLKEDPAGEVQLSDDDLESVAGGGTEESLDCTASQTVCKGTCCFPPGNWGCCEAEMLA